MVPLESTTGPNLGGSPTGADLSRKVRKAAASEVSLSSTLCHQALSKTIQGLPDRPPGPQLIALDKPPEQALQTRRSGPLPKALGTIPLCKPGVRVALDSQSDWCVIRDI
jgi:hypothetical protein